MHKEIKSTKRKKYIFRIVIVLIILLILSIAGLFVLKTYLYPKSHFDIVKSEAQKNNIDPYLVLAVIKTESNFNKKATSNKNAKGLMQIMDSTAADMNKTSDITPSLDEHNIYDVDINIALGCKYFSRLIEKYNGNYYIAICAYNAGMGNVDKWLNDEIIPHDLSNHINTDIPFPQTKKYLEKVIKSYNIYRKLYK